MIQNDDTERLGADIRAIRKARGVTQSDLAHALDRSLGWVSQVERGITLPKDRDLQSLAKTLNVPVSLFFGSDQGPQDERGIILRAQNRRTITSMDGLTESLVSPDLSDDFEVLHSVFATGAARKTFVTRPTQEVGFVLSGRLRLFIGDRTYDVEQGDSFRIREQAFRWENPFDVNAVVIWVIAPPVY